MARNEYQDYLGLGQLLTCQSLESVKAGRPAHDEMLFVIVHQTYELWFKQIIHELNAALDIFKKPHVAEEDMGGVVAKLERINEIQKLMLQQVDVLETMTALDFLEFRDLLYPASGFQSFQFRLIENKLGLESKHRLNYNQLPYTEYFDEDGKKKLIAAENEDSLFDCVERWLARTPFLKIEGFKFWESYKEAVDQMYAKERELIGQNKMLSDEEKQRNYEVAENAQKTFSALFDRDQYEELRKEGRWRLSFEAVHAALFIQLYRDQPILNMPFRLVSKLLDIDKSLTHWRYRHALMAKRMLGTKVGTGGSSGAKYLRDSTEKHKIFTDFFQLTTFFIPRSKRPELPGELTSRMNFNL